ncbi:unnamed protein product [Orchesella dallaii]|uniref:PiggyBac transposable element-derived protein domain-containing protein n=1 Tax=Orchesella dallaii TaxID=48710 RepID=A0ABP1Q439_9HEXA
MESQEENSENEIIMGMLRNFEYEMDQEDATSELSQEHPDATMDESDDEIPEAINIQSPEMDDNGILLSLATPANAKTWNWILGGNQKVRTPFANVSAGWTIELPEDAKEMDFWKLTFPDRILSEVVKESNDYAIHVMENADSLSRRQQKFQAVSYDEFLRYLAVRIIMRIDQKPEMAMYWSKDPILGSIVVRDILSSDRFYEIQRYLHLSDTETPNESDKIFKIRKLWDLTMNNFQNLVVPNDFLSVDESLVKSRARIKFKQFIPTKRNRFGVKTFSLVDERTGFIVNSVIYEGKAMSAENQTVSAADKKQFGHGGGIVLQLCQPYLGEFRTIFADNYFNSPNLAEKLLKENTYLCGTLRSGRLNAPKPPKGMKRGDLEVRHDEQDAEIMVEFWRDKGVVKMISTGFEHALVETNNAAGAPKQKLKTIIEYNNYARGIDRADQMMGLYDTGRKTMKWYL